MKHASMKYRSRMDIINNILQSAMKGATKTRLMYSAYLSYAQLKEYISFLQERGLIELDKEMQLYKLTEKGLHFLNVYDEISQIVSLENKVEQNVKPFREIESAPIYAT